MLEGRLLSERYEVKRLIGGGGMANVYLGFDKILDREVAIKVLRIEYSNDDEFITRFHREAQSATSLSHPNIVNIYDVGEEDDIYYMVMEYVEGLTLKEYIQRYGPISVEDSVEIMLQITSAIEHAHANHIVHRDIKPQNILINTNREAKVTDFGIALALTATSLTQTNSILGSVHYLSPEQARGGMANRKSDIYSLGIVLFEMLTGRIPFNGQSAVSIALKHLQTQTPSMRDWDITIPQSLENIVLKATAKDPFHRYQTVAALEKDLMTALNPDRMNEPVYTPPTEPGDETKAIPVINNEQFNQMSTEGQTRSGQESTQPIDVNDVNQEEPKKEMSRKKKVIIWVASILAFLLSATMVALFVLPQFLQPDDVEIPDLTNEPVEEAVDILTELGFQVEQETVYSEDIEAEHVVRTDPDANSVVKEGDTVTLYVSGGPEPIALNDYTGQSFSQVERLLTQQGFEVTKNEVYSDEPEGAIVNQVPGPNAEVIPSETTIEFDVSIGQETIELESLENWNLEAARQYLRDRDLIANVTEEHSDEVTEGNVIRHSPGAGEDLVKGTVVYLTVSLGEEEQVKAPITHTLTVTVPYTGQQIEPEPDPDPDGDEDPDEEEPEAPEPVSQEVRIYIDDMTHDLTDLYETESITSDTEFTIRLVIAPNSTATYKIERDDQVFIQKTVAYEDLEEDD